MSESNWRDVLKSQQEDLKRLQQNAVIDDDLDADIEKILNKSAPSRLRISVFRVKRFWVSLSKVSLIVVT